ncbi:MULTISPECIES: hypothetical protein [unclassified Lebetimonas]|uniref:hypothetical protein n=1 Tax=unclassified Lebetimonas TaxID=2648158 RepID=UPI00056A51DB
MELRKVYELKKGILIKTVENEILEFDEIRGDKAVFYNDFGIEVEYPDYLDIDEIGEIIDSDSLKNPDTHSPTLF